MANPNTMELRITPTAASANSRFVLGLMAVLSLALVGFEWRSAGGAADWAPEDALPLEGEPELLPLPSRKADPATPAKDVRKRAAAGTPVLFTDPVTPEPLVAPDTSSASSGAAGNAADSATVLVGYPPEEIETVVLPWSKGDERMPCWTGCEQLRGAARDACTEARIQRHLDRYFRIPPVGPRDEFTVITMEIGVDGRPGVMVCRPTPSSAVEREVQRVVAAMPAFKAGEQNGKPVRVMYQLPLRVSRR